MWDAIVNVYNKGELGQVVGTFAYIFSGALLFATPILFLFGSIEDIYNSHKAGNVQYKKILKDSVIELLRILKASFAYFGIYAFLTGGTELTYIKRLFF